jgi:hypothetical protein
LLLAPLSVLSRTGAAQQLEGVRKLMAMNRIKRLKRYTVVAAAPAAPPPVPADGPGKVAYIYSREATAAAGIITPPAVEGLMVFRRSRSPFID